MNLIAVDVETYDPNLKTFGDGSCRDSHSSDNDNSCLLCVSIYDGQQAQTFFPFTAGWNTFLAIMADKTIDKIFHNGIYDLSWLICGYDVVVNGLCHDTMTRMTYIDEYASLDLDSCCKAFHVTGKNKGDTIEAWYDEHKDELAMKAAMLDIKIKKSDKLWAHALFLWKYFEEFRTQMVKYNQQDCRATYNLYIAQEPKMRNVMDAYLVDVKLTPLIVQIKKTGVRIDMNLLKQLTARVEEDLDTKENILKRDYGIDRTIIGSSKKLTAALNALGIHSPVITPAGAESWSADAKARLMHYPVMPLIVEVQGYAKLLDTYFYGGMAKAILSDHRIHCTFSPNKREDGGTVTGRFACSHPNLQQIPARDKQVGHSYGQDMRALFLPEEGCMMAALDYSQIEYLLLAHFAVGPQAEWFREQANAGVDFHTVAMQATGIPSRTVVKTFNYGVIYGMGWKTALSKNYVLFEKAAAEHNMTPEQYTKKVYDDYHTRLPVIKATMAETEDYARMYGYVMTIGGRYQHKPKPMYDSATGRWQDFIYKMLNKRIQGSAADILKFALLKAYEGGVFDVLTMHLTVHDENVVSVPFNKIGTEACVELQNIMNNSFKDVLKVPMKACCELGPNWGYWSGDIFEEMKKGNFDPAFFDKDYKETH